MESYRTRHQQPKLQHHVSKVKIHLFLLRTKEKNRGFDMLLCYYLAVSLPVTILISHLLNKVNSTCTSKSGGWIQKAEELYLKDGKEEELSHMIF